MIGEKSKREPVEYNSFDYFFPLVSLRHLPKISKLEDSVVRNFEYRTLAGINFVNTALYSFIIYESLQKIV